MLHRMLGYMSSWAKSFTGDDDAGDDTPLPGPAVYVDTSRPGNRDARYQLPPARNADELLRQADRILQQ